MLRSARNTVMWVGKAAVFLIGLAVIAVTVLGVASTAFAGNGDPLKLGHKKTPPPSSPRSWATSPRRRHS